MDEVKLNGTENIVELLELSLSASTGNKIFDRLDFSLSGNQTAIIIGPTGAGKTSLLRILIGDLQPDSGTVLVFGEKVDVRRDRGLRQIRKKIGGVGGIFRPVPWQTVNENLMHPLILTNRNLSDRKARMMRTLKGFGLLGKKWEKVYNLSLGEKLLLMLARATIVDQPLLLLDEPLAGLDPEMSARISALIVKMSVAGHSMMIMTTGQTRLRVPGAAEYCLENGRIR